MYRRIVLSSQTATKTAISVLYHVHGAVLLSQQCRGLFGYDASIGVAQLSSAVVFDDVVRLLTQAVVASNKTYEFILDVAENQPDEESVEEITSTGVAITVYNEHGVAVCHNGGRISTDSNPPQTNISGEMTSEPIGDTGEMTNEPIDGTGEMASEPIDGTSII